MCPVIFYLSLSNIFPGKRTVSFAPHTIRISPAVELEAGTAGVMFSDSGNGEDLLEIW